MEVLKMINIDMWYGNKIEEVTKIDINFYGNSGEYRGNIYIDNRIVGDYSTKEYKALENTFKQLVFN